MVNTRQRATPKKKAVEAAATPQPIRNEKNEIISWSCTSDEGRLLKLLVENGNIKQDMTAGDIRKKYPMFAEYSYSCFSSGLANARKSFQKEIDARQSQTGK